MMKRIRPVYFIIAVVLLIILLSWAASVYVDYLWYENLGYGSVFVTVLLSRWGVRLGAWLIFFLFLFVNLWFIRKALLNLPSVQLREWLLNTPLGQVFTPRRITYFLLAVSLFLSFIFSAYMGGLWLEARQFFQGVQFGLGDPIFQQDISYYIFRLPFLRSLYSFLQAKVVITTILVGITYYMMNPPVQVGRRFSLLPYQGQGHLSLLLAFFFLLKSWDYRLKIYELLFSTQGVTFGPGYTDMNANLPALWILFFLSLAIAGVLVYNIFRRQARLFLLSIGLLVLASLVVGGIYPAAVQHFRVAPNEFVFERPYLEHNISFTQKAFALDRIRQDDYPALQTLDWGGLEETAGTLENVRLWDYRPLRQTYNQLQGIRLYYDFFDVDTDRYVIDGRYQQVMLSAREMNQRRLAAEAQTWVNLRLQYTHGYGLAMSPVAKVTPQGLPEFVIRDVPPVTLGGLEMNRPEIYYGELSSEYVIVNTRTPEFNYPMGETNVFTHYEGSGGVLLHNFPRRLLFALRFQDFNIILTGELENDSRIMFNRPIRERANRLAPFLRYDEDPYLVLHEGRLFWIIDAYTVTSKYPYAEPYGGINYMRNSVKVVIDAYNGTVDYYIVEPQDPLVQTYASIFPDLFQPMEAMPEGLLQHLRYPEAYFLLQARVYATYHMSDPGVFYNREDLWNIPNEKYAGTTQPMEPYYTILQLPGEDEPEFVLILPFTPARRDNMIAWMAGRCDGENYGELQIYFFPKDRVIFGPMQIETRIDQNPLIAQQLTLWDQRGSRVIRGNLLVLPVADSILYVEPVFLQADQSELPELVRVIVGFRETVVMEPTLEEALVAIFGRRDAPIAPPPPEQPEVIDPADPVQPRPPVLPPEWELPQTVPDLARRAQELFDEAQEKVKEGDWAGYGRLLDELERTLQELLRLSDN